MEWDNNLINLRDILADLYYDKDNSRRVVREAGLRAALIQFQNAAIDNWYFILEYARLADPASINKMIDIAAKEYPQQRDALLAARVGALTDVRGKDIATDVRWQGPLDAGQLEKITGKQSTLMAITFLEMGMHKARSVARVQRADNATGSGFLIRGLDKNGADVDILITNNHVLRDTAQAATAKAQFNYQSTLDGLAAPSEDYAVDPEAQWATSEGDDWSAVLVKPNAAGKRASETFGALPLAMQNPQKDDFTIIVQHPGGRPKEIALYHNVIAYVDNRLVQYLTDTQPGSSGSPVFDTQWNVIALHHSGGMLREPTGDPKQTFFRNEGIHVNTVIDGLAAKGIIRL